MLGSVSTCSPLVHLFVNSVFFLTLFVQVFRRVVCMDVRKVLRRPLSDIRVGAVKVKKAPFLKELRPLFFRNIVDPAYHLEAGFFRENLCLPSSIAIQIYHKNGRNLKELTLTQMKKELEHLEWRPFVDISRSGISFKSFTAYEKKLSPIPETIRKRFPLMTAFKGIGINVFQLRKSGAIFKLFPISLSKTGRDFFQVDLLLDSEIRTEPNTDSTSANHLLLIKNLGVLINRFSDKRGNIDKYNNICRACLYCTTSTKEMDGHKLICNSVARNFLGRRKSLNVLLHRPFITNKYTGRLEPNGITFRPGDAYMTIKNLSFITLDYECFNRQPKDVIHGSSFESVPSETIYAQSPLSWAYCHKALYADHPLPKDLETPRYRHIDETDIANGEKNFYLSLFLSLRKDLVTHAAYVKNVFDRDTPAPPLERRSTDDLIKMMSQSNCLMCGRLFGSKTTIERKARDGSGTKIVKTYRITRTFDHDHATNSFPSAGPKLRSVLCQVDACVCCFF